MKTLLRWLVQVQGTEAELGGFKGRTNKLVDGCYSWWCGGAFALLEALGIGGTENAVRGSGGGSMAAGKTQDEGGDVKEGGMESETWDDVDGSYLVFVEWYELCLSCWCRLFVQPKSSTRVHSIRHAASCRRPEGQTAKVQAIFFFPLPHPD
jgi:hypothetical protein